MMCMTKRSDSCFDLIAKVSLGGDCLDEFVSLTCAVLQFESFQNDWSDDESAS
jgi:hypothetical protein